MCVEYRMKFGCRHRVVKRYPCGGSLCAEPFIVEGLQHDGECKSCIGYSFPLDSFGHMQGSRTWCEDTISANKHYAESMVDFSILLLAQYFPLQLEGSAHPEHGSLSVTLLQTHRTHFTDLLRSYYRETACHEAGNYHRRLFSSPCDGCPSTKPRHIPFMNPIRQFRLQTAHTIHSRHFPRQHIAAATHTFSAALEYFTITAEVEATEDFPFTSRNTTYKCDPLEPTVAAARREQGFQMLRRRMEEVICHGHGIHDHCLAYTIFAAFIVNIFICVIASDPYLPGDNMLGVVNLLCAMLVHPSDQRRFPSVSTTVCTAALERLVPCYLERYPSLNGYKDMVKMVQWVASDFRGVEQRHRDTVGRGAEGRAVTDWPILSQSSIDRTLRRRPSTSSSTSHRIGRFLDTFF